MNTTMSRNDFSVRRSLRRLSIALAISGAPLLAINLAAPSALGQASSSSDAVGKVTDPTGASVSGATVHLVNNGTGSERTATTNDAGEWSIPNLPPANYRVRVEKQGFNTSEIKSLDVEIGKTANGSVQLAVGAISQTVEVSTMPAQLQTEIFAYGRMPLAFSARCFTARFRDLPKDDCQFSCIDHPDGLLMQTREHQDFLVLNGIQTQSALVYNLVDQLDAMRALGVEVARISPQANRTVRVVELFDAVRRGDMPGSQAMRTMQDLMPDRACNGYWHARPGLDLVMAEDTPA